ncbi:MAG TPA: hypothetical protein PLB19_01160 [Candidatus Paceibacterota bacterium]|nr:hypothetical protein [Candidatus Paceibacterota bacterium]HPQ22976.1 hypothetical protein [Candidatus Paceibacterota bacterium]HRR45746.1 hypothetical protein [Candidatus Paceibacterota bacterium]
MTTVQITTKDNQKHQFVVEKGEDILVSLDKFLKSYKINKHQVKSCFFKFCKEDSFLDKKIGIAILKALNIKNASF